MQDLKYLRGWLKEVEDDLESGHYDVNENVFSEIEVQGLNNKALGRKAYELDGICGKTEQLLILVPNNCQILSLGKT